MYICQVVASYFSLVPDRGRHCGAERAIRQALPRISSLFIYSFILNTNNKSCGLSNGANVQYHASEKIYIQVLANKVCLQAIRIYFVADAEYPHLLIKMTGLTLQKSQSFFITQKAAHEKLQHTIKAHNKKRQISKQKKISTSQTSRPTDLRFFSIITASPF